MVFDRGVRVVAALVGPDVGVDLFRAQHLIGVACEFIQHFKFLARQIRRLAVENHLMAHIVDDDQAKSVPGLELDRLIGGEGRQNRLFVL